MSGGLPEPRASGSSPAGFQAPLFWPESGVAHLPNQTGSLGGAQAKGFKRPRLVLGLRRMVTFMLPELFGCK